MSQSSSNTTGMANINSYAPNIQQQQYAHSTTNSNILTVQGQHQYMIQNNRLNNLPPNYNQQSQNNNFNNQLNTQSIYSTLNNQNDNNYVNHNNPQFYTNMQFTQSHDQTGQFNQQHTLNVPESHSVTILELQQNKQQNNTANCDTDDLNISIDDNFFQNEPPNINTNTKKRCNNVLDNSNHSNEFGNEDKMRKVEEIAKPKSNTAPIVIFNVDTKLLKNKESLEKVILEATKDDNVNIRELKITENGSLLIFPKDLTDSKKIMQSKQLFANNRKIDLNIDCKKHLLMIKGINAIDLTSKINAGKNDFGIKQIHEIKNKDGRMLKMCKVELNSLEYKKALLREGSIQLGLFKYSVENLFKPPLRCHNCKRYGHSILNCSDTEKCAKCGGEHKSTDCKTEEKKCLNCGENHSCYYKGCKIYKEQIKNELENKKKNNNIHANSQQKNKVPDGFVRSYSDAVNISKDISKQIDEKLDNFMKDISSKLGNFTNQIQTNMNALKTDLESSFSKLLIDNNIKSCYFLIDLIKIMFPNCEKPTDKAIQAISNRFNCHHLGSISTKGLTDHTNKLWR